MKRKPLGQSSEHFKWLYTNVRCMGNKPEELGILIHNQNYVLIGLAEVCSASSRDWNIDVKRYGLFREDSGKERRCGLQFKDISLALRARIQCEMDLLKPSCSQQRGGMGQW